MALQAKEYPFSRAAEAFLDILIEDYGGHIPFGEMGKIAEKLGVAKKTLYNLNSGCTPEWTKERNRRLDALISLDSQQQRVYELERLFRHKIDQRSKRGMDWTDKDPVEILSEVRKEYAHEAERPTQQNVLAVQVVQGLSGDELQTRLAQVEEMLRMGQYTEDANVLDGTWSDESRVGADAPSSDRGESTPLVSIGAEAS